MQVSEADNGIYSGVFSETLPAATAAEACDEVVRARESSPRMCAHGCHDAPPPDSHAGRTQYRFTGTCAWCVQQTESGYPSSKRILLASDWQVGRTQAVDVLVLPLPPSLLLLPTCCRGSHGFLVLGLSAMLR